MMAEVGRRRYTRNAKRRSDAVNFLANISLDGSFSATEASPARVEGKHEARTGGAKPPVERVDSSCRAGGQSSDAGPMAVTAASDGGGGITELDGASLIETALMTPIPVTPIHAQSTSPSLASALATALAPAITPGTSEPCSPDPRSRTRLAARSSSALGVSSGSLRIKSVSTDRGSPQFPSKFDSATRPRVLLVSTHKVPISLYSVLPYSRRSQHGLLRNDSETTNPGRTRKTSGTKGSGSETYLSSFAGVELGDGVKEKSYRHLLIPTKDQMVYRRQHSLDVLSSPHSPAMRKPAGHPLAMQWDRGDSDLSAYDHTSSLLPYDPMELDDPGLHAGKHSKVMTFTSYMVSILDYTKPSELKKDINQKFKDKFPHIDLTLSKLRSIKRDMRKIVVEMGTMDLMTLAHAYVYFEKLVLYGKINKENRKLCAAACLTLAAKLNDTKGAELQSLIKEIEDTFRESRKDFLQLEFPILVALEFSLHLPENIVLPHYRRIAQLT